MRNSKVHALWYDPETDDEWEASGTFNHPWAGTYYDPPEGGDIEDIEFTRSLNGIAIETLDESEFVDRFGERAFDAAVQSLYDATEDLEPSDPPDEDDYDPDDDRSPDSFDPPDRDGP